MEQLHLFSSLEQQIIPQPDPPPNNREATDVIRGLRYVPDYKECSKLYLNVNVNNAIIVKSRNANTILFGTDI